MANADASNTRSLEDGTIVQAFADRRLQYNEEFRFMSSAPRGRCMNQCFIAIT